MKNITINLPKIYLKNIQKLIDLDIFPNRSETVRTAIREFLHEEYDVIKLFNSGVNLNG